MKKCGEITHPGQFYQTVELRGGPYDGDTFDTLNDAIWLVYDVFYRPAFQSRLKPARHTYKRGPDNTFVYAGMETP